MFGSSPATPTTSCSAPGAPTARSSALAQHIEETLKKEHGARPSGIEGLREGRWALIDYGDIVVHVFLSSVREFYNFDRLWGAAPEVPVPQEEWRTWRDGGSPSFPAVRRHPRRVLLHLPDERAAVPFYLSATQQTDLAVYQLVILAFSLGAAMVILGTMVNDVTTASRNWRERREKQRRKAARDTGGEGGGAGPAGNAPRGRERAHPQPLRQPGGPRGARAPRLRARGDGEPARGREGPRRR